MKPTFFAAAAFLLMNIFACGDKPNTGGGTGTWRWYARYSTAANPVATAAHLAADWVRYDNGRKSHMGSNCRFD